MEVFSCLKIIRRDLLRMVLGVYMQKLIVELTSVTLKRRVHVFVEFRFVGRVKLSRTCLSLETSLAGITQRKSQLAQLKKHCEGHVNENRAVKGHQHPSLFNLSSTVLS